MLDNSGENYTETHHGGCERGGGRRKRAAGGCSNTAKKDKKGPGHTFWSVWQVRVLAKFNQEKARLQSAFSPFLHGALAGSSVDPFRGKAAAGLVADPWAQESGSDVFSFCVKPQPTTSEDRVLFSTVAVHRWQLLFWIKL